MLLSGTHPRAEESELFRYGPEPLSDHRGHRPGTARVPPSASRAFSRRNGAGGACPR